MKEPKIPPSLLLKEKARIKDGLPHVIILSGQGYSMLWPQGQPIERHDWGPGSCRSPIAFTSTSTQVQNPCVI
jgi:hypothetical protein